MLRRLQEFVPTLIALVVAMAGFAMLCTSATAAEAGAPLAIVVQDQVPLRAAPRDSAQQQAMLWQGDALEVRGERLGFVQVYDHRRERAGYVRAASLRRVSVDANDAPELLAVLRFLRDTPGSEALGIAYAAAFLKAAPADAITAEPFDALGTMAERLARRASARRASANDAVLAAHLESVAGYGVVMLSFEREGRLQLCYDGEAFRRVLALRSATSEQRARAALALTRHDCVNPALRPAELEQLDAWRSDVLERIDLATLSEQTSNRIRLRRAGVWAAIAYERTRRGESPAQAAERAVQSLAAVNKNELAEDDQWAYSDAAVRASASRWGSETGPSTPTRAAKLSILTSAGQPGETCVSLVDATHDAAHALLKRCTYGTVWVASASANASGSALALAVQPLSTWRELWVFHRTAQGWAVYVLPPGTGEPELGVLEFAGWVPGGTRLLAAREVKVDGRFKRSFEILRMDSFDTERQADAPQSLSLFYRWQDPAWKRQTLSLR